MMNALSDDFNIDEHLDDVRSLLLGDVSFNIDAVRRVRLLLQLNDKYTDLMLHCPFCKLCSADRQLFVYFEEQITHLVGEHQQDNGDTLLALHNTAFPPWTDSELANRHIEPRPSLQQVIKCYSKQLNILDECRSVIPDRDYRALYDHRRQCRDYFVEQLRAQQRHEHQQYVIQINQQQQQRPKRHLIQNLVGAASSSGLSTVSSTAPEVTRQPVARENTVTPTSSPNKVVDSTFEFSPSQYVIQSPGKQCQSRAEALSEQASTCVSTSAAPSTPLPTTKAPFVHNYSPPELERSPESDSDDAAPSPASVSAEDTVEPTEIARDEPRPESTTLPENLENFVSIKKEPVDEEIAAYEEVPSTCTAEQNEANEREKAESDDDDDIIQMPPPSKKRPKLRRTISDTSETASDSDTVLQSVKKPNLRPTRKRVVTDSDSEQSFVSGTTVFDDGVHDRKATLRSRSRSNSLRSDISSSGPSSSTASTSTATPKSSKKIEKAKKLTADAELERSMQAATGTQKPRLGSIRVKLQGWDTYVKLCAETDDDYAMGTKRLRQLEWHLGKISFMRLEQINRKTAAMKKRRNR